MSLSNSRLAYLDCIEVYDRAVADPSGIRIRQKDMDAATYYRTRLHQARKLDREENGRTYEDGHPMFFRSIYDKIVIRIRQVNGGVYLYLEQTQTPTEIESLTEIEDGSDPMPQPVEPSGDGRDRDSSEDRRQEGVDDFPIRGSEGLRRI